MNFLLFLSKFYYDTMTKPTVIFGILLAVVIILLWRRFKPRSELITINGEIESYGAHTSVYMQHVGDSLKYGCIKNVTIKLLDSNEKIFFKNISFKKNLWINIAADNLTGFKGKFCAFKRKTHLWVFAMNAGG